MRDTIEMIIELTMGIVLVFLLLYLVAVTVDRLWLPDKVEIQHAETIEDYRLQNL